MLSIFRRNNKNNVKKTGLDSSVSSEQLLNTKETTKEIEIHTELSLHPLWNISTEQMYVLRFLNNDLPPLKPNQISLSGIDLKETDEGIEVTAFIRNSLSKGIKFDDVDLLLLDENKQVIAKQTFQLDKMGEIPGKSSRPWEFLFPNSSKQVETISKQNWTIAFELESQHALDLDESWKKSLAAESKQQLENIVNSIEPPKHGEVNFMGIQIKFAESGDLHATVLIRNGHDKNISIEQLPLQVEDAAGDIVAKGSFKLDSFEVRSNTSKPWTFIFPKSIILKNSPDFSRWKVMAAQK